MYLKVIRVVFKLFQFVIILELCYIFPVSEVFASCAIFHACTRPSVVSFLRCSFELLVIGF